MRHCMIDLETWGRKPGCAIRSVGAVMFDEDGIGDTFYANIDDASCEAAGLVRDPETEAWWADQSPEAQSALLADQRPLGDVLLDFKRWFSMRAQLVWGHGASFDPPILEGAYEAIMLEAPWKFWDVRCSRTVLAMANRKPRREGLTHHHALDDAIAQAKAIVAAVKHGQFSLR